MTGTADTEAFEFQQIYGPGSCRDSDAQADDPQGSLGSACSSPRGTSSRRSSRISRSAVEAADSPRWVGTTSIETSERLAKLLAGATSRTRWLERQAARARGATSWAGSGPAGRRHHRHQHGGARHDIVLGGSVPGADRGARKHRRSPGHRRFARPGAGATTRCSPRAACTSSAPSATSRGASTISCAAPLGTPGRFPAPAVLFSRSKTPDAHLRRPDAHEGAHDPRRHEGREADLRAACSPVRSRTGAAHWVEQHNFDAASSCSNTMTFRQTTSAAVT